MKPTLGTSPNLKKTKNPALGATTTQFSWNLTISNATKKLNQTSLGEKKIIMKTIVEKQALSSTLKQQQESSEMTLQKIIVSLTDNALEEFLERHIFSLQKILEQFKDGFV